MTTVLTLAAGAVAMAAAYLLALSAAALRAPPVPPPAGGSRRFAILIPAHNEVTVIGRVLASVGRQQYAADRFETFVVADACSDGTAEVAQAAGAIVHVRHDETRRGKGHAVEWLLERVREHGEHDAYVVLDADSIVDADMLARFDARLAAGSLVIQARYGVLNADASPIAALRAAALASLHYLRPLGRAALGLSVGLKGNGMCFAARVLEAHGWTSHGLAEDVELHLSLVASGTRVDFAPEIQVRADMPVTLRAARTQNLRWERGRLATVRRLVVPLIARGIARRDVRMVDAGIEQLVPPLSAAVGVSLALACASAVAGATTALVLATLAASGFVVHVLAGLVATRAPLRAYGALALAPGYVAWKLALYGRALITPATQPWVRTPRALQSGAEVLDER